MQIFLYLLNSLIPLLKCNAIFTFESSRQSYLQKYLF